MILELEKVQHDTINFFKGLHFEEEAHIYCKGGIVFPSVSGLVDKYKHKPNFNYIKKCVAKREGKAIKEITKLWDEARDSACELGTETHLYAETYTGIEVPINPFQEAAEQSILKMPSYLKVVHKELRMYHKEYLFAGTMDLLLLDTRTNTLVVADYKTNKDLFKHYAKMKKPFQYLDSNNFNAYNLQLSYYQMLVEQTGYKVSSRILIWLKKDGNFELFKCEDYVDILKNELDGRKN